jgi:hypothetical protein
MRRSTPWMPQHEHNVWMNLVLSYFQTKQDTFNKTKQGIEDGGERNESDSKTVFPT